jgi:signal transduction histidine kinase
MRQPIHSLTLLNGCLEDYFTAHVDPKRGASMELISAAAEDSRQMRDVLAHLKSLVDDFLVFSSMTSSTFSLNLSQALLPDVCSQVERVCGVLATEKGSTFKISIGEGLTLVPVLLLLLLLLLHLLFSFILLGMIW